jgi:hypothetical protein
MEKQARLPTSTDGQTGTDLSFLLTSSASLTALSSLSSYLLISYTHTQPGHVQSCPRVHAHDKSRSSRCQPLYTLALSFQVLLFRDVRLSIRLVYLDGIFSIRFLYLNYESYDTRSFECREFLFMNIRETRERGRIRRYTCESKSI